MGNRKLASVIIPCYNQGQFLGEAIESVYRQSYENVEIIVVDDGSTDDTSRISASFDRVRRVTQVNRGVAGARNSGLEASRGDYIVFLDADDRLLRNALQDGVNALRANRECAFVYGHVTLISTSGSPLPTPRQAAVLEDHYLELLRHNYIWSTGAVVYRRDVLESVGGFNGSSSGSADFDLNARIARILPIGCCDTTVLEYRRHDASMSRDYALMLKGALAARRAHRRIVKGQGSLEEALRTGIRRVQEDYGEKLIEAVGQQFREGHWRRAMYGMTILLQSYPRGVFRRAGKKLSGFVPNPQS